MTALQQPPVPIDNSSMDDVEMNNHDDYGLLMSMALDSLLDRAEQEQLNAHLVGCARCRNQWRLWQSLDVELRAAPLTAPSAAFVQNFGQRLAAQDRRRQMRLGVLLGIMTVVMWLIGVAGVVFVIGALVYNQVGWFTETVHWLVYAWTALSVVGRSLLSLAGGLTQDPSAIGLLAGYIVLAGGVMVTWLRYLRRSLQPVELM